MRIVQAAAGHHAGAVAQVEIAAGSEIDTAGTAHLVDHRVRRFALLDNGGVDEVASGAHLGNVGGFEVLDAEAEVADIAARQDLHLPGSTSACTPLIPPTMSPLAATIRTGCASPL